LKGILLVRHWKAPPRRSVEGTHHKHRKLSAFTLLASICVALHPAEVHKRVLNTLIALIITFGQTSHGKIPLESHFEEAHVFLAVGITSALDMPEHWYAPMLPADYPSSFCKLSGLTTEDLIWSWKLLVLLLSVAKTVCVMMS
jgi:hypothetical protein